MYCVPSLSSRKYLSLSIFVMNPINKGFIARRFGEWKIIFLSSLLYSNWKTTMSPIAKVSLRCYGILITVNVGGMGRVSILVSTPDSERCR